MSATHDTTASQVSVAAAIRGDREALSALWNEHRRWVAAVLLTFKPREADLDDLLQEVAMRLVSKIDTVREESNVRAWLRAVAVNVARSAGRGSRGPVRFEPADLTTVPTPAAAAVSEGGGDAGQVVAADQIMERVARLPEHYREPLMLRAVKGMRAKEIAAILDVPPATVDTRIARARRMLREGLGLDDDALAAEAAGERIEPRAGARAEAGTGAGVLGLAGTTRARARNGQGASER